VNETAFELRLNAHAYLRCEVFDRRGTITVAISRFKITPSGPKPTGNAFELAGHHFVGLMKLMGDVERTLIALSSEGRSIVRDAAGDKIE
jgi:hypothetical protein